MKVKIGDTTYDSEDEPVMLIATKAERDQIAAMPAEATCYCQYPDHLDADEIKQWMDEHE